MDFKTFDQNFKRQYPRLYPWAWFVGLWFAGLIAITVFAYGLRWLIILA